MPLVQRVLTSYVPEDEHARDDGKRPEFWDLFCGMGGASEGARLAGYKVAFAADSCPKALHAHAVAHPHAVHACLTFPSNKIPFPTDGRAFHVHGSPPCTHLSTAGNAKFANDDYDSARLKARSLVRWYIDTAFNSGASTWSMEQVSCASVKEELQASHVPYLLVDFSTLGVPQKRKRIIAGSRQILDRISKARVPRCSIRQALGNLLPSKVRYVRMTFRDYNIKSDMSVHAVSLSSLCRPVTGPCYTVTQAGLMFCDKNYDTVRTLNTRDLAVVQGFSRVHPLGTRRQLDLRRQIANAVPPPVMRIALGGSAAAV